MAWSKRRGPELLALVHYEKGLASERRRSLHVVIDGDEERV